MRREVGVNVTTAGYVVWYKKLFIKIRWCNKLFGKFGTIVRFLLILQCFILCSAFVILTISINIL